MPKLLPCTAKLWPFSWTLENVAVSTLSCKVLCICSAKLTRYIYISRLQSMGLSWLARQRGAGCVGVRGARGGYWGAGHTLTMVTCLALPLSALPSCTRLAFVIEIAIAQHWNIGSYLTGFIRWMGLNTSTLYL